MAQWIWKFGEFEIYHSMLVHDRRQQYGYFEPVVWKIYGNEPAVVFRKKTETMGGTFYIASNGKASTVVTYEDGRTEHLLGADTIVLKPGKAEVVIRVSNIRTFPAIYVEGIIESDESWEADDLTLQWRRVGTWKMLNNSKCMPERFPFAYTQIKPVSSERLDDGVLFDFGRELFAGVTVDGLGSIAVRVRFGESKEEAMDVQWSVVTFEQVPQNGKLTFEPYAFRYVFVSDKNAQIKGEYEYLPMTATGSFSCNDACINKVWETAAYTFHLNCREFFLDGIKRDRWVWSGDAYQSLFVNRYLFFDKDIEQRTLIALGGKRPFQRHINTIMDYTFLWIISIYDHYVTFGAKDFLVQIMPHLSEVMAFCRERKDCDGFVRGKEGDWVFIDWADIDKTGAVCGEQILYAKALECYSSICRVLDMDDLESGSEAKWLQKKIIEKFYDQKQKSFVDSFESGKNQVTRHSNLLAYLFLPMAGSMKKDIYDHVILNANVPQITTPYFKFFENQVHCLEGNVKGLEDSLRNYYGAMLQDGATTFYEAYDPHIEGADQYAMYGRPFEKSLCHAWSASPVYLLGNFRLGVSNTGIGYETFDVRPCLGGLEEIRGTVPVVGGIVSVYGNRKEVCVMADVPGGTLHVGKRVYTLVPGVEITVQWKED